jgi:diadenosine tetraphosphate (Ap4A) HIT family hydrolase
MDVDKALEVDHIVPKSLGGVDSADNYQALCYSCNAAKRNTDSTDFRGLDTFYETRDTGCIFCSTDRKRVALNELAYVIEDGFPVSPMHRLIIPKRHVADYFGLHQPEVNAITRLITEQKESLQELDPTITGFNIGMNCGESAGQTIFHCHIHLIPRRAGDVENPRGGIRHVIPGRGNY